VELVIFNNFIGKFWKKKLPKKKKHKFDLYIKGFFMEKNGMDFQKKFQIAKCV
jgi:hypothetical protein